MRTTSGRSKAQAQEVEPEMDQNLHVSAPFVTIRDWKHVDGRSWDRFALDWGGSYRGSRRHALAWSAKRGWRTRVRFIEVWRNVEGGSAPRKTAQVVVALSGGEGAFLDRLVVGGEDPLDWISCMQSVIQRLPSGTYTYGWDLNTEAAREGDISALSGVEVVGVRPLIVHVVEFATWSSWDDYYRAMSTNVRRNVKKAHQEFEELRVVHGEGWRAIRLVRALLRLRTDMYERKGLRFREGAAFINSLANALVGSGHFFTSVAAAGPMPLAAVSGVVFGGTTYYMEGGSSSDNRGASWFLLVDMLRRAYQRDPLGRVVMGYLDPSTHDEELGGGLLRSRRSCRVTNIETSIVRFVWNS